MIARLVPTKTTLAAIHLSSLTKTWPVAKKYFKNCICFIFLLSRRLPTLYLIQENSVIYTELKIDYYCYLTFYLLT